MPTKYKSRRRRYLKTKRRSSTRNKTKNRKYSRYIKTKRSTTKKRGFHPQYAGATGKDQDDNDDTMTDIRELLQTKNIATKLAEYLAPSDQNKVHDMMSGRTGQLVILTPDDSKNYFLNTPIPEKFKDKRITTQNDTFRQKFLRDNDSRIFDNKNQICLQLRDEHLFVRENFNLSDCYFIKFQRCNFSADGNNKFIENVNTIKFTDCPTVSIIVTNQNQYFFKNIQRLFFRNCTIYMAYLNTLRSIPYLDFTGSRFRHLHQYIFGGHNHSLPSIEVLQALESYINLSHTNIESVKGL